MQLRGLHRIDGVGRPKFDFHTGLDDKMQRRYVAELAKVVRTGGRLYVGCFSDANPDPWSNPRRLSEAHLRALFAGPTWRVEAVEPAWYERPPVWKSKFYGTFC